MFQLKSISSAATTFERKQAQVRTLRSRRRLVVTVAIVRVGGQRQLHSHVRHAVSTRGGLLASCNISKEGNMAGEGAVRYNCGKPACSSDHRTCQTTSQIAEACSNVMGKSFRERVLILCHRRSTAEAVDREMHTRQAPLHTEPQASTFFLQRCTLQLTTRRHRTYCANRLGNGASEQPGPRRCHQSKCFHGYEMCRQHSPSCLAKGVS